MKKITFVLTVLIALTIKLHAQIPNSGFESLSGWATGNATLSTDHYPASIGNYSIKLENQIPLINQSSYGYAVSGSVNNGCIPSFPVSGHPTKLCGYYKCFPLNNDTIQIGIEMFKNGIWIAGGQLITTSTVSTWTSFNIPIFSYTSSYTNIDADSATITVAAFYNDTTCGMPYGPFGNSILYVDNISFDNLITSTSEQRLSNTTFRLYPNPASDIVTLNIENTSSANLKINIYNIIGNLVKSDILKPDERQLNISDLNNGVYMVTLISKDFAETERLIIQR